MIDIPQIVQTSAQITAFIHLTVTPEEMQRVFAPTIVELISTVTAQGITPVGPVIAHHLRGPTDTFDFRLSIPVSARVTTFTIACNRTYTAPDGERRILILNPSMFIGVCYNF